MSRHLLSLSSPMSLRDIYEAVSRLIIFPPAPFAKHYYPSCLQNVSIHLHPFLSLSLSRIPTNKLCIIYLPTAALKQHNKSITTTNIKGQIKQLFRSEHENIFYMRFTLSNDESNGIDWFQKQKQKTSKLSE